MQVQNVFLENFTVDKIYFDNNESGFKPLVLSGITEDDQPVVFNILGYEVK